jgi:putative intracellular protease/amidase
VKGKNVTGFSNTEEAAVGLTDVVPFLLKMLYKLTDKLFKVEDWHPYAVEDGLLITGQNQLHLN